MIFSLIANFGDHPLIKKFEKINNYRFLLEYVTMNRKNFWEETEVTKWKILQVFPAEVVEISRQMEAKNLVWPGSGEVWIPIL